MDYHLPDWLPIYWQCTNTGSERILDQCWKTAKELAVMKIEQINKQWVFRPWERGLSPVGGSLIYGGKDETLLQRT